MLINAIKKEKRQLRNEGKAERSLEIANRMLSNGEPLEKIRQYTGLSGEELKKLRREMAKADPASAQHATQANKTRSNGRAVR